MPTSVPEKFYVNTDKDYYVQGEAVEINGMLTPFVPGSNMEFWVEDSTGNELWRSPTYNQPYNHGGYQTTNPPISIFTSKPPYYAAFGKTINITEKHNFAYY